MHVFSCGHGDTILLRLPGTERDRWILVDCYLPRCNRIRDKFFELIESLGITTLDYIFLTHPDYDHFYGMVEVIDYFSEQGRSLRFFADGGFNSQQVRDLLRLRPGRSAYTRLQKRLDELDESGAIEFFEINDQHRPISPKGYRGRVDLVPIGPGAGRKRRLTRRDTQSLSRRGNARLEANGLSVVLALTVRDRDQGVNLLLAADADIEGIESALDRWSTHAAEMNRPTGFDLVKVPHHGSIESHSPRVYAGKPGTQRKRIACISAGSRPTIPAQEVLRDYLDHNWVVMLTRKRGKAGVNRPMQVSDRSETLGRGGVDSYNLTISWAGGANFKWRPAAARVRESELVHYELALRDE